MKGVDADAAMAFLSFVEERHRVYERRQSGASWPWTDDPILRERKFTNVFRVLDYGSQFLIRELVADPAGLVSDAELLMRCFLYRHTGRWEAWEHHQLMTGDYPRLGQLDETLEVFRQYRGEAHVRVRRSDPKNRNRTTQTQYPRAVFTNAYLVFPQTTVQGSDKLESIIRLTQRLFEREGVAQRFLDASSQAERFAALRGNKGVADFMSMQILTDWGYTDRCEGDLENDFVVAGPGARKGAAELAPGEKVDEVIRWARAAIHQLGDVPTLEGRTPSLMDVQNCLCEFSKYARYSRSPSPKKTYQPAHPGVQLAPVLPAHW